MVQGVSWIGVRAEEVTALSGFFEDVLGLRLALKKNDFHVFDAPNGDRVEVFGPRGPQPGYQFQTNSVMVGFSVSDLDTSRARLVAAGVELLGDPERRSSWQHFRGPDGLVYELNERKRPPMAI